MQLDVSLQPFTRTRSVYIAIKGEVHHVIELSGAKFLLSSVVIFFLLLEITLIM